MIQACREINMKPLCDHPSYCKTDNASIYIGQDSHIAHPPTRNNDNNFPTGWKEVRTQKLTGAFCTYTRAANGNYALCTVGNSHAWKLTSQITPKFPCVSVQFPPTPAPTTPPAYTKMLAARNGVPSRRYDFQVMKVSQNGGNFSNLMVQMCGKIGMKPLCDHPNYCKTDSRSIYIGQNHYIAYPPHRKNDGYFPAGWADVRKNMYSGDICVYTNRANGNYALCSGNNTHAWKMPTPGQMIACVKVNTDPTPKPTPAPTTAPYTKDLAARNGVPARRYRFNTITTMATSGNFSAVMINECKKLGMKPLCDHQSYCKNDNASVYIGQTAHIAYPPQRNNNGYFPAGWADVRQNKFSGPLCVYTARANGNNALCTVNNTHAWKTPYAGAVIACAVVVPPPTPAPWSPM